MIKQTGVTLLELLVALAIFAVISVTAYSGLQSVLDTRSVLEAQAERLSELQLAMHFLERDIEQAVPRSIRDEFGQRQAALQSNTGDALLTLTRNGWDNPLQRQRSALQRLSYRIEGQQLIRVYWDTLDRGGLDLGQATVLLNNLQEVEMRFLAAGDNWYQQWPPADVETTEQLPRAIELRLVLSDWGEITRLLPLVGT